MGLTPLSSLLAAVVVLLIGTVVNRRVAALSKYKLTRLMFEKGRDFAARGSAQGTQVSAGTARAGLSVPLHVAAARALDAIASGKPAAAPK
jgi:hypothetical protein